eukprot:CAMPEP_0174336308 /NCGR_PEP_ID=MMETSP0810-20121108/21457_1 /TAXON_ID=73025 ORGANISM="Eutreptiella gymnastica-like, Strain CCMP1594" /NCGR_SAMPLE_ID=MMETSP0810 /ASSEMBLY_ACC=CAM_ASM_000659 /LENGTH=238 /DNA_ID=CAMNT_0015455165 /DNA_START=152 /DNA_END=865 /DNA_ORIENTATION=+
MVKASSARTSAQAVPMPVTKAAAEGNPFTSAALAMGNTTSEVAPQKGPSSVSSLRASYAHRRSSEADQSAKPLSAPATRPATLRSSSQPGYRSTVTASKVAPLQKEVEVNGCGGAPLSPKSPRSNLSVGGVEVSPSKYKKSPREKDALMEQHHPYRNKPTPAAPSRITGYSGHRPRAYEPVGVGFNRIEMTTDNDYAHNVTYESINNPAFSTYPDGRPRRRLSAPASSRGKVQQEQAK